MLLRTTAKQLIALLLCLFLLTALVPAALAEDAPAPGDAPAAETAEGMPTGFAETLETLAPRLEEIFSNADFL